MVIFLQIRKIQTYTLKLDRYFHLPTCIIINRHEGRSSNSYITADVIKFWNKSTMKTKECPGCAMDVDAKSDECPICEYEFPKQSKSLQAAIWLFILLMLFWVFF